MIIIHSRQTYDLSLIALKTALDFSYSGIIVIDKEYTIIYMSQWACEFLDIKMKECLNKKMTEYFPNSSLIKTMKNHELERNKIVLRNNKKVVVTRVPLYENGEIIGGMSLFQDVLHIQENEMEIRNKVSEKGFVAKYNFTDIISESKNIRDIIDTAKIYAKTSSTILITGESGTGKEIFAQSIHNYSNRKEAPFVPINCATLPETILESELFGYADATFTGAKKGGKIGLFQQAQMGTIFLDEIGEIPLSVQAKLLRVLQEKQVRPVGSDKVIPIDVRVISATNKNLFSEVEAGRFRLDLLYRLNVLNLNIPPLRERREDIEGIANNFFNTHCPSLYKNNISLIKDILSKLSNHKFLGNVRELENILERLSLVLQDGKKNNDIDIIMNRLIDAHLYQREDKTLSNMESSIRNKEKQELMDVLVKVKGSRSKACEELGISSSTLWRKMKKHNLS